MKHGLSSSRLYHIYSGMQQRCLNPCHPQYKNYGAKGITICDEWLDSFTSFVSWSYDNGYEENLTIDRIDPQKGYQPDNCQWITKSLNSARVHNPNASQIDIDQKSMYNGTNLRYIRLEKGLSVPALSRLSNVPIRTIEDIEKRGDCKVSTAKLLADALEVSLDELCADDTEEGR